MKEIAQNRIHAFQRGLLAWYRVHGRNLPWRRTHNPYHILLSEMMLQQTQVDRVLPKYRAWLRQFPTVRVLATARTSDLIRAWQGLGYNRRALYIQRIAQEIVGKHRGRFPRTTEALLQLPGVGPYTARAIMSFAYGAQEPILDTNVKRVIGRVFVGYKKLSRASDESLWDIAARVLPTKKNVYDFNQGLMDFGSLVCTMRAPDCAHCPVQQQCASYPAILTASAAQLRYQKKSTEALYFGKPRRIWRGKILTHLHAAHPRGKTCAQIGAAIQTDFSRERIAWLTTVLDTLIADGFIEQHGARYQLRQS